MLKRLKLFAGIELDELTRAKCAEVAERLRDSGIDARFEAQEKYHITLAFLGWVDPEIVEAIRDALARTAESATPCDLTLDKLGAFPHERRPRVVWIGTREQGAAFRELSRSVRKEFEAAGFVFEKDAIAHVTIARVKGGDAHLPILDVAPIRLSVKNLTLFESVQADRTTRYEARAQFRLRTPL